MQDLIERLEKATGPDRELDIAIHDRLFPTDPSRVTPTPPDLPEGFGSDIFSLTLHEAQNYTASIDAALTLVQTLPDDFGVGVMRSSYPLNIPDTGPRWGAEVWNIRERVAKDYQENLGQMKIYSGKHASPAIALCIALLKAQSVAAVSTREERLWTQK